MQLSVFRAIEKDKYLEMHFLQNTLFIISTSTGIIFIITAIITSKYPPKKINMFYGYRTKKSMQSKDRWDFAQIYSTESLYKYGILLTFIGILCLFTSFSEVAATIIGLIIIFILIGLLMYKTEKAIDEKFGSDE